MSDPLFRLRNAIGEFLGYGGCPVCGRTYFGVGNDLKEAFHWIDLPSTWRYEHAPDGRRLRGGGRGWIPMCTPCWDARTPAERMAAMERVMSERGTPFDAAAIADIRQHTLGKDA